MHGHKVVRISGGPRTESGWKQMRCSCGWESPREHAYNDYQFSNLREHVSNHYAEIRAAMANVTDGDDCTQDAHIG